MVSSKVTLFYLSSKFLVFDYFIFKKKCDFLQVVKILYTKNRVLVNLRSFFSTYKKFPRKNWLFPVRIFKTEYFDEKMSSVAGLKKAGLKIRKSTDFGHFWLPESTLKDDFLNVRQKFEKIVRTFVRGGC